MHVPRATRDFRPPHLLGKGFPLNKLTARGSALSLPLPPPEENVFSRFHRAVLSRHEIAKSHDFIGYRERFISAADKIKRELIEKRGKESEGPSRRRELGGQAVTNNLRERPLLPAHDN